jgi:hypothetical protein
MITHGTARVSASLASSRVSLMRSSSNRLLSCRATTRASPCLMVFRAALESIAETRARRMQRRLCSCAHAGRIVRETHVAAALDVSRKPVWREFVCRKFVCRKFVCREVARRGALGADGLIFTKPYSRRTYTEPSGWPGVEKLSVRARALGERSNFRDFRRIQCFAHSSLVLQRCA